MDRRHQRLDDEHVRLATVCVELHLQTVVGEAGDGGWTERHLEVATNRLGKVAVGGTGEHDDLPHGELLHPRRPAVKSGNAEGGATGAV